MEAQASDLRWAKYGDVYYAVLEMRPEDAGVTAEPGEVVVYFIDGGDVSVLPAADVEPYDPLNVERSSVEAAAPGVSMANSIYYGTRERVGDEATHAATAETAAAEGEPELEEDARARKERKRREKEERKREKKEKAKAKKRRSSSPDSMADAEERSDAPDDDDENDDEAAGQSYGTQQSPYGTQNVGFGEEDIDYGDNDEYAMNLHDMHHRDVARRGGRDGANATQPGSNLLTDALRSVDSQYSFRCQRVFRAKLDEAARNGFILSIQQVDFVDAVKTRLQDIENATQYMTRQLEMLETFHSNGAQTDMELPMLSEYAAGSDRVFMSILMEMTSEERDEAIQKLKEEISELHSSFSVEQMADELVSVKLPPPDRPERKRNATQFPFVDTAMYLMTHRTVPKLYRVLDKDLAVKYNTQARHRQQIMARDSGVSKLGFTNAGPRVMERWHQAREIAALPQMMDVQPVAAHGFTSRRYSEATMRAQRSALRRASQLISSSSQSLGNRQNGSQAFIASLSQTLRGHSIGSFDAADSDIGLPHGGHSIPAYYNFHEYLAEETRIAPSTFGRKKGVEEPLLNGTQDMWGLGSTLLGDDEYSGEQGNGASSGNMQDSTQQQQRTTLVPLNTNFDPYATFSFDDPPEEVALTQQLAEQSMNYSVSVPFPSQDSVWQSETHHGSSAASESIYSASLRSSALSSALYPDDMSNARRSSRAEGGRHTPSVASATSVSAHADGQRDWRSKAKRVILQQLTLYLRGLKGRPQVLTETTFASTAHELLTRAVASESKRTNMSMLLQSSNASAVFSKEVESSLRRSVDHYVRRHFIEAKSDRGQGSVRSRDGERNGSRRRSSLSYPAGEGKSHRSRSSARNDEDAEYLPHDIDGANPPILNNATADNYDE